MTKRILNLLTVLVMAISLAGVLPAFSASAETSGDYEYTVLGDGTVEITKYNGSATELEIPSKIDEKVVTSIGNDAFVFNQSLTSITISKSVTKIGVSAFWSCRNLTSVIIPDSITSIGGWAFKDTPWLEKKQKENPFVVINGILIDGTACNGDVSIPDGVTTIGDSAFNGCRSLTSITISDSVISIDINAFFDCDGLLSVTIGKGVTDIGERAFMCENLSSITIPSNVKNICDKAFGYDRVGSSVNFVKVSNFKINCYTNTVGEQYAITNGFDYKLLDNMDTTEPNDPTDSTNKPSQNPSNNPSNSQTTYNPNGNCDKVYISGTDDSMSGVTTNKDIYVPRNCTLTFSGTNTINGNLYIYGTVENLGTLTYTGTMYCLHYGSMLSAGSQYDYGYLYNRGSLKGNELVVNSSYLSISIPTITHKEVITYDKVDATCTEDGQTSYQVCATCNTQISTPEVIPAMGHNYENGVCKACGEKDPNYKQPTNQPSQNSSNNPNNNSNNTNKPNSTTTPTATPINNKKTTPSTTKVSVAKPAKVKAVKLTAKKKKLNVKWKKISGATGYEVMYATNNKFTKNKKTVTVKKNKVTLKRLKTKKKYFVKVRAYKKANGNTSYGNWSKFVKKKVR